MTFIFNHLLKIDRTLVKKSVDNALLMYVIYTVKVKKQ